MVAQESKQPSEMLVFGWPTPSISYYEHPTQVIGGSDTKTSPPELECLFPFVTIIMEVFRLTWSTNDGI